MHVCVLVKLKLDFYKIQLFGRDIEVNTSINIQYKMADSKPLPFLSCINQQYFIHQWSLLVNDLGIGNIGLSIAKEYNYVFTILKTNVKSMHCTGIDCVPSTLLLLAIHSRYE